MNMQTVTFDADLYNIMPIEPTKPDHILKAFWERAMQGYKFILKNSLPINTEG